MDAVKFYGQKVGSFLEVSWTDRVRDTILLQTVGIGLELFNTVTKKLEYFGYLEVEWQIAEGQAAEEYLGLKTYGIGLRRTLVDYSDQLQFFKQGQQYAVQLNGRFK